jgi:hypothetical protein
MDRTHRARLTRKGPQHERRRAIKARRCVSGARRAEADDRSRPRAEAAALHSGLLGRRQVEIRHRAASQNRPRSRRQCVRHSYNDTVLVQGRARIATCPTDTTPGTSLPPNPPSCRPRKAARPEARERAEIRSYAAATSGRSDNAECLASQNRKPAWERNVILIAWRPPAG